MAHPFAKHAKASKHTRAHAMGVKDAAQDRAMMVSMIHQHDRQQHHGHMTKLAKGGKVKKGGTKVSVVIAKGNPDDSFATPYNKSAQLPGGAAIPPILSKRGGRIKRASGGRVHNYPKMRYGSESGEGRLEKRAKYGHRART
jgi:hypothetical protein